MMKPIYKLIVPVAFLVTGCASNKTDVIKPDRNMDQIYEHVNKQGKRDTVSALREGLRMNHRDGTQDPFIPIRNPALVVPVWVPTQTHPKSGERISGHWKWLEVEEEKWAN